MKQTTIAVYHFCKVKAEIFYYLQLQKRFRDWCYGSHNLTIFALNVLPPQMVILQVGYN